MIQALPWKVSLSLVGCIEALLTKQATQSIDQVFRLQDSVKLRSQGTGNDIIER